MGCGLLPPFPFRHHPPLFTTTHHTQHITHQHTQRLARALGLDGTRRLEKANSPNEAGVRIHHVRDVAPKKPMLCLSFPLGLAWEE